MAQAGTRAVQMPFAVSGTYGIADCAVFHGYRNPSRGDGCNIYQNVTLGGTGKDHGKRHPTLGKNVLVGSGAKILGPFNVGDNAKIAANSVVLSEVPPNSTCVGAPARIVRLNGQKVGPCDSLDQIHIPDPVSMELCRMNITIERLTKTVEQLQDNLKEEQNNETV